MNISITEQIDCNRCGGKRTHEILETHSQAFEDDSGMSGRMQHDMLKCAGCGTVVLGHYQSYSLDLQPKDDPDVWIRYYPPVTFRREPQWLTEAWLDLYAADDHVYALLNEIYIALQNEQVLLAAMGSRALLERISRG